ncbi:MAG: acyl-CoA dehydrogenase family protein [Granulosicoccus sp.]|nr:acyl-CoA dehydrogenase family protein [Granulosicoccus sp.]
MLPFSAPVDDILFSLHSVAKANELDNWNVEIANDVLRHFAAFAEEQIAPLNAVGDQQGCVLNDGKVSMPPGFSDAYTKLATDGWQGLSAPERFGGMEQSPVLAAAVSEVFSGANHAMQMVCNLVPGAINTLLRFGSDAQQRAWIPKLAAGEALSTMCLTESGAGSDLSRIQTRAVQHNGKWAITGEKIFISGGDQDMSDDILHLVLARTGTRQDGVKGLSLFLCSKLNASTSITVSRIEDKLGLHASPTCQLVFDETPAELLGEEGCGLNAMFTVMTHARIDVALQGIAHAARANAIALAYAQNRKQGKNKDGVDAVLAEHADVQRMLQEQRRLTVGARAMAHIALVELEKGTRPELAEFLTPLCKFFCTEAGIRAADLGIQILGGYGYINEYQVSQTWRDARITSIYEGANGIHYLTLATRGLHSHGGSAATAFDSLIGEISNDKDIVRLRDNWRELSAHVSVAKDPSIHAYEFAQMSGQLFFKAVLSKIETIADSPMASIGGHSSY